MFPQLPCTKLSFSTLLAQGCCHCGWHYSPLCSTGAFLEHGHSLISCHLFVSEVCVERLKIKSRCVSREEEMVSPTENTCTTLSPLVVFGNYRAITKANLLTQNVKIGSVSSYSTYFCLFACLFAETWLSKSPKLASNSQSCLSFKCTMIIEYEPSYPAQPNLKMNRRR